MGMHKRWLGWTAGLLLAACGPQGQILDTSSSASSGYAAQCHLWSGRHSQAVKDGKYEPVTVEVSQNNSADTASMTETEVMQALLATAPDGKPTVQWAALFARSGLGKSRLAEALRAQLCGQLPFYLVDAKKAAAQRGADNPVLAQMTARGSTLAPSLSKPGARLLVALDGLDEVAANARGPLLQSLVAIQNRWPNAQLLILARPPVAEPNYGLGSLQWKATLSPLQCARVEAVATQRSRSPAELEAFWQFLRRHELDAKTQSMGNCSYAFLQSYGDLETLQAFVRKATAPQSDMLVSRTHAHEALLAARLTKELEDLGWTLPQALQLLDNLMGRAQGMARKREPRFSLEDCLEVMDGMGVAAQPRVCEKLFQSPLITPIEDRYAFSGPELADLFTARWLAGKAATSKDCKALTDDAELLHQGSVFTFVLGQPGGQQCLPQLMNSRCDLNPKTDVLRVFDDGLPGGPARTPLYNALKAGYESIHWKLCAKKTLEGLSGTL